MMLQEGAIICIIVKIQDTRINHQLLAKLDVTIKNVMFGDNDINIDLGIDMFDIDVAVLQEQNMNHIFQ